MDLSCTILDAILSPSIVLGKDTHEARASTHPSQVPTTASSTWDSSSMNPKNRIDSLDIHSSQWRIDGSAMFGRRIFAVPTSLLPDLIPLRVDVYIPDQEEHPVALRSTLQSSTSVCERSPSTIANLGISRHICRALDQYCDTHQAFWTQYSKLPFGSKLVFDNISADVKEMPLVIVPAHALERQSLSIASLRMMWDAELSEQDWPLSIDITSLRLVRQLQDSISVVSLLDVTAQSAFPQLMIFKSNTTDLKFLYHELKIMLTMPRHPNIMSPPVRIVTKKCSFGGKHGVFGFLLPFYPLNSLRNAIPMRASKGNLTLRHQLKWCRQIVSAMIHTREQGHLFYSDLRPDNILLSTSELDDCDDVILTDFEQRGNWREWCAPEIRYSVYMEKLRPFVSLAPHPSQLKVFEKSSLAPFASPYDRDFIDRYRNASHEQNITWFAMDPEAQEKAEVYSLGLLFYCIFEGLSDVKFALENKWPWEPQISFPTFHKTPNPMRECIRKCTSGAPEWEQGYEEGLTAVAKHDLLRVVRIEDKLYPGTARFEADEGLPLKDIAQQVYLTAKSWWEKELEWSMKYAEDEQNKHGDVRKTASRPKLCEVLAMLEKIEAEI